MIAHLVKEGAVKVEEKVDLEGTMVKLAAMHCLDDASQILREPRVLLLGVLGCVDVR